MFSLRQTAALLATLPLALAQNSSIALSVGYNRGDDVSIQTDAVDFPASTQALNASVTAALNPAATSFPWTRTRCMTYFDTTSRSIVETDMYTSTSYRTVNSTSVYNPTVTVTPNATTSTGTITTTATTTTTTLVSQSPLTVPLPTSFRPFQSGAVETASAGIARRRPEDIFALKAIAARQNPTEQPGFSLNPDGSLEAISAVWPRHVHCDVRVVELRTATVVSTGAPVTVIAAQPTQTIYATRTVTVTETETELLPRSTVYPACASNNVVSSVRQSNSSFDYNFWQIQYRPFIPAERQVITKTASGYLCCVACMTTPNCAGSFWHPKEQDCHISLSIAPSNTNGTAVNGTIPQPQPFCARGSSTVGLGSVNGSPFLPKESAMVVSNGPCGNFVYRRA